MTQRLPEAIGRALDAAFGRPMERPLEDAQFDALARSIFAWQFERVPAYAAWCRRRERTPATVSHWTDIPAVPTAAFREATLVAGDPERAEAVFRTSGTTHGSERRGTHRIADLSLYHRSLLPGFAAMLLPDGARPAMLSIVPPPRDLPDSSLSHMIDVVMQRFGSRRSGWFATAASGIDDAGLDRVLRDAAADGMIVCILGTSFSFVHWIDALRAGAMKYRLPDGSRLMDTGGFKGRSREVGEDEMLTAYGDRLGIEPSHCINEYGMTEMCSQFYDSTLRDAVMKRSRPRRKIAPPWVRTRVVDPETLEPLPQGTEGLLQHFDLANANSVCAIQTEDLGVQGEDGFLVLGRAAGAMPRGCSIAMDELLEVIAERRPST
jgi:Acyl-protein synthetase, LuxE